MSLRLRLFALILTPLVLMSLALGYWRFVSAQETAEELFDNNLMSAALAISRDVAVSGGDALLPSTRDMIQDAAGGELFYHVTAPDGIYVTGYAYPPIPQSSNDAERKTPHFSVATYREEPVRVLQISERISIENLSGVATVTVWQRLAERQAFAAQLALRTAFLIAILLVTLALVIWFGVARGLRPLLNLQDAISMRSPDDLSRIKRKVPEEVQGIVDTLNRLFRQVETSIEAHQVFISDAAHQLRNPAAAVHALAKSVRDATNDTDRDRRIGELLKAARNSSHVAHQLLSLDRLRYQDDALRFKDFDLRDLLRDACTEIGPVILSEGLEFEVHLPDHPVPFTGDPVFIAEAIKNLIDNAAKHGGPSLTSIQVALRIEGDKIAIAVEDDGKGLRPEDSERAFSRFSQLEPSAGSGLGLAVVSSVAERHGGKAVIIAAQRGTNITLRLPRRN